MAFIAGFSFAMPLPSRGLPRLTPLEQQWLDVIAYTEGTDLSSPRSGYNVYLGDRPAQGSIRSLVSHPGGAAAGRYQFIPKTWKWISDEINLRDFSPYSQDLAALELIRRRGIDPQRDPITRKNIAILAPEWASFPTLEGKSYYGQRVVPYENIVNFLEAQN